jgi:hypothetical protein
MKQVWYSIHVVKYFKISSYFSTSVEFQSLVQDEKHLQFFT